MDINYDDLDYSIDQDDSELFIEDEKFDEENNEEIEDIDNSNQMPDHLDNYIKIMEDKLMQGIIDDYTFSLENLLVKYRSALIHKRFNITNDRDKEKINQIRKFKKDLDEELINLEIDDLDYSRKYFNLLTIEYNLLLQYEDFSLQSKKIKIQLPNSFEKGLDALVKQEEKYLKNIAKERSIYWPDKPKINKKDSKKIKLQKYLTYYLELDKATNIAKKYIPGYKLRTIEEIKADDKDIKYTLEIPTTLKYEKLLAEYNSDRKDRELLFEKDKFEELKIEKLRKILKLHSKEQLIECLKNSVLLNKLSYIERLKLNKIPVMKFRQYPETYQQLQDILGEEAKYYKITEKNLLKDFKKKFYNVTDESTIELKDIPSTFKPTFLVKIGDTYDKTILPDGIKMDDKLYDIQPSTKGYSFLLKINEISKNKEKKYSEYLEKGSVVSISLKKEFFKSSQVVPGVIDEKFYSVIKPLDDDLYLELKKKNLKSNKTDIVEVYELHIPVSTLSSKEDNVKLVRRYERFEDYLFDLKNILEANMLKLEEKNMYKSADVLYKKIEKIKKYLETGNDYEFEIDNKYSSSFILANEDIIIEQRKAGLNKLREYISEFYPNNDELIEVLENDIFDFDNKNYANNINRIIFIFNEFSDTLTNYIMGSITVIELIGMELPLILPPDDLPEYFTDPKKTLKYLYSWQPNCTNYLKYKDILDKIKDDLIEFKNLNLNGSLPTKLTQLEINDIYSELHELSIQSQIK